MASGYVVADGYLLLDGDVEAIALFSCDSRWACCLGEDPEPAPLAGSAMPTAVSEHTARASRRARRVIGSAGTKREASKALVCLR